MASIGCMCTHHASSAKSASRMASAVISIRPHLPLSDQLLRDPLTSFSASLITDPNSLPSRVPVGSPSIESSFFCFCAMMVPCQFLHFDEHILLDIIDTFLLSIRFPFDE